MNYFDKLPTIAYNNQLSKNLLARAGLSDKLKKTKTAFHPYTMADEDRIDLLSNYYYDSPGYTWLVWLTNNHIDPYYSTPLSEEDFNDFIASKYGSYAKASRQIEFYRNNWYDNIDETLTVAQFNSLNNASQKYYEPVLDGLLNVAKYIRKRHDDKVQTNKIIQFDISSVSGTFVEGEEVQVDATNYAFVTYANDTTMTCRHVTGTLSGTITGQQSGATATVGTVSTIAETLASTEAIYWSAVSSYEYEQEINEAKKAIRLLSNQYRNKAEADLERVMKTR